MTDSPPESMKAAIQRAMKEVAERFARDPTPTDGSARAELEMIRRMRKERGAAKRQD